MIPHFVLAALFAPALHVGLTYWGTHQSVTTAAIIAGTSAAVANGFEANSPYDAYLPYDI